MTNPTFGGAFNDWARTVPDLERLVSRIHAGSVKQTDFLKVVEVSFSVLSLKGCWELIRPEL